MKRKRSHTLSPVVSSPDAIEKGSQISIHHPRPRSASPQPQDPTEASQPSEALDPSGLPLPLTKANLALLQGETGQGTMSASSTSGHPHIPNARKRILERHGLFRNKHVFYNYPDVKEAVEKVLKNDSTVEMTPDSAKKALNAIESNDRMAEGAYVDQVWHLIFRKTRKVNINGNLSERHWTDDGLATIPSQPFLEGTVSDLILTKEERKQLEKHIPRLMKPKPDLCFGLHESLFTRAEVTRLSPAEKWVCIQEGLFFPFALMEFKGADGTLADAEDQALRGGSTLVDAARQFHHLAGGLDLESPGADAENIVFSVCMTTCIANIHIHWRLIEDSDYQGYHMNKVRSYDLSDEEQLKKLRRGVENIMTWGLFERKDRIKNMLPDFPAKAERVMENDEKHKDKKLKKSHGGSLPSPGSSSKTSSMKS
ncbi:MAG: hypothetical protein Q9174_004233 [Haloplaca sp. 1 TL-2023]